MVVLLISDTADLIAAAGTMPALPCYSFLTLAFCWSSASFVDSRWSTVIMQLHISKVFVPESEEPLQPDALRQAHHLHAFMATPHLTPLPHPSGLRRVLPEPAQPGE